MAIYMAAILLLGDEEDDAVEHNQVMRVTRRILRDVSDPFSIPDNEFRKLYRLTKDTSRVLIEELVPFMPEISRKTAIPHELQILASLNFFAAGSYQRRVGQDFLTCMSQTSLSRSLHATVNALISVMDNWICFPVTADRIQRIKQGFFRNGGFPGVIGAIDGTHVAIFPPEAEREYLFINRKLYHSLNVLVVNI
ncbi:unnamed protein product [Lasius platythorax]|uniref:Nuclease HARBI1 n=1 Tax=Lasius platythorax TaxID=488582 RepID=A0AAV2NEX0_9HYME